MNATTERILARGSLDAVGFYEIALRGYYLLPFFQMGHGAGALLLLKVESNVLTDSFLSHRPRFSPSYQPAQRPRLRIRPPDRSSRSTSIS